MDPAPFSALRYVGEWQNTSGNEDSRERERLSPRKGNVASKFTAPEFRADYRKKELLQETALGNMKTGEALLVSCVLKYSSQ